MTNLKRLGYLLALLLPLSSSVGALQSAEWVKFLPEGGGFTILMPSPPKPADVKPTQDFSLHLFTVTSYNDVYLAGYGDYAPGIRLDIAAELIANRDNFLLGVNAALRSSKAIELNGHSGLEFTGDSDQYEFKSRVYIFGNRVYQIAVALPKGTGESAGADRFFASFAFTNTNEHTKP